MAEIDRPRDVRGLAGAPELDENDAAAVRQALEVAGDVAGDLRAAKARLYDAGLLSQGWGPKMGHRFDVQAHRLDQVAVYLRRRLAKLEPAADATKGKP
jgi:hypothetical protein